MLVKGGEVRITNSTKSFDGSLFIFEKAIIVTRLLKKPTMQYKEVSEGIFEWRHLKFKVDNHEHDRGSKEITLYHRNGDNIFKIRKRDNTNIFDFVKILDTYIMDEKSNYITMILNKLYVQNK